MNLKKLLVFAIFSIVFFSFKTIDKKVIIVDAGHGGNDLGATRNGISEKEVVLEIASKIKELNSSQQKYEVILTRDSDANASLSERTEMINKLNPEMVISLHMNSSPEKESAKQGHEIYIQNSDASKVLAEKIANKLGSCSITEKNLHLLRESKAPTVLVELGFMNNTKDREYLTSEIGQKEMAQKFVEIINQ